MYQANAVSQAVEWLERDAGRTVPCRAGVVAVDVM